MADIADLEVVEKKRTEQEKTSKMTALGFIAKSLCFLSLMKARERAEIGNDGFVDGRHAARRRRGEN